MAKNPEKKLDIDNEKDEDINKLAVQLLNEKINETYKYDKEMHNMNKDMELIKQDLQKLKIIIMNSRIIHEMHLIITYARIKQTSHKTSQVMGRAHGSGRQGKKSKKSSKIKQTKKQIKKKKRGRGRPRKKDKTSKK